MKPKTIRMIWGVITAIVAISTILLLVAPLF